MANSKNFVVDGPVEVGTTVVSNKGTITSNDIDLSTGNYFSDTLLGGTTFTFSNPSSAQSFQLELTNGVYYDLTSPFLVGYKTGYYITEIYDYFGIYGLQLSYDGRKLWYNSSYHDDIKQLTLSTPFDITTASSFSSLYEYVVAGYNLYGFHVPQHGNTMYAVTQSRQVIQFDLSSPDSISTATHNQTLDLSSDVSNNTYGVALKSDGTEMYVSVRDAGITGSLAYYVFQYSLSTAWDISTATFTDYVSLPTFSYAFSFHEDGTIMMHANGATMRKYVLSTAWDISTATLDSSYNVPATTTVYGTQSTLLSCVDHTGTYIFAFQDGSTAFEGPAQFDIRGSVALTWPASVEGQNGSTPGSLVGGETAVYSFSTSDGGTSYQGSKVISITS